MAKSPTPPMPLRPNQSEQDGLRLRVKRVAMAGEKRDSPHCNEASRVCRVLIE